jgi:2-polyprenyl-6-methoxyphenol hydroxylase-like FAD-dependent oxidoreductase
MEPNLGQGGCQGIEDAAVLSRLASACQPDQLVKAFERERLARVRQIQLLAARAGSTVHAGPVTRRIGRALLGAVPTAIHQIAVDRLQRFQN